LKSAVEQTSPLPVSKWNAFQMFVGEFKFETLWLNLMPVLH